MEVSTRPFSAGSRQTPDPYDQFLEREGFYRKHTARDSTCLFRVISEQIFDVQLYHEKVRADCVNFMRKRRDVYEKQINIDFDDYLDDMSKYSSYGTFVELDALAHTYRRNILLFEPYNCGSWFVQCESYDDTLMVFFSPDKHFDSIFSTKYIIQAAYCQALVYEILYVRVFKLPDVLYSVERMLHDPEEKTMKIEERRENTGEMVDYRIVTTDGRQFVLDLAENTECVLDNFRLCHFHNKENFSSIVDSYRHKKGERDLKETRSIKTHAEKGYFSRDLILVNPMLCDKKISCVRQLLKEGITPFPYKVAKALDPSIYRNIEFDSWSDMRRELKYRNWYFGGNHLQIGVKCLVRLNEADNDMYYGYIQEMLPNNGPCIVYIEDIAECRTVPYDRLQTLPADQIRHWAVPYKPRKYAINNHIKLSDNPSKKRYHTKVVDISVSKHHSFKYGVDDYTACCASEKSVCFACNNIRNFRPTPVEMVVMPFLLEGDRSNKPLISKVDSTVVDRNETSHHQSEIEAIETSSTVFDVYANSNVPCTTQSVCYSLPEPYSYDTVSTSPLYGQPYAYAPQLPYSCPIFGAPNPVFNPVTTPHINGTPNFQAVQSISVSGSDLPFHDIATLRYFYNLGIEHFRQNQLYMQPPILTRGIEMGNVTCVDTSKDEASDMTQLTNHFESSLNILSNYDSEQKSRGSVSSSSRNENHTPGKRKFGYSLKTPKKCIESKNNRPPKGNNMDMISSSIPPVPGTKQNINHVPTNSGNDVGHDYIQTFPYSVPVYTPTAAYSVGVPYYPVDSTSLEPILTPQGACYMPTYMYHPYGAVMAPGPLTTAVGSTSDAMTMHDNTASLPVATVSDNHGTCTGNGNFSPMMYSSPQLSAGYTVLGYTQQPPVFNTGVNNNSGNQNTGSGSNNTTI